MIAIVIILKIILYIFLTLLAILIAVIALPFTYSAQVLVDGGVNAHYNFGWPGKLVQVKGEYSENVMNIGVYVAGRRLLRLNRRQKAKLKKAEEEVKDEVKEVKEKAKNRLSARDFLDKSFIEEILNYIKKVFNITKPRLLHLSGTYGFDDPSLTGITYGLICVVRGCIPQARLDFYPCFTEAVLELDFETEGELVAAPIIYQTLRTILKKPVRKKIFKKKK